MQTENNRSTIDGGLSDYFKSLLSVSSYKIGDYVLDVEKKALNFNNESVKLTKKEAYLLVYLVANKNTIIERTSILNEIWNDKPNNSWRSLDVYMFKIRKFLSKDPNIIIISIHGKGYKMILD